MRPVFGGYTDDGLPAMTQCLAVFAWPSASMMRRSTAILQPQCHLPPHRSFPLADAAQPWRTTSRYHGGVDELSDAFLAKAEENIAASASEYASERYNASANRTYFAAFQAAVSALADAGIHPPGRGSWGHDFVQAQFAGQLINRRKLYAASLRSVLSETMLLREIADYDTENIGEVRARRALRKAQDLVNAVRVGRIKS
jgi:uncharacterized protein (UPF0332 family)